jgi:hypothetical protein
LMSEDTFREFARRCEEADIDASFGTEQGHFTADVTIRNANLSNGLMDAAEDVERVEGIDVVGLMYPSNWISAEGIAERLGLPESTIYSWITQQSSDFPLPLEEEKPKAIWSWVQVLIWAKDNDVPGVEHSHVKNAMSILHFETILSLIHGKSNVLSN